MVDQQRRIWRDASRISNSAKQSSTSATEFTYMRDQGYIENPYQHEEDADDDDDVETVVSGELTSEYSLPRSGSSTSLRSASGDSGLSMMHSSRTAPPRFPAPSVPSALSLRTQQLQNAAAIAGSPGERLMDSYFSPSVDSPISSRTSSSSGMFPFPRQTALSNGWSAEDHARFTAPAMGRAASRESPNGPVGYPISGRNATQRPSLPPHAGPQQATSTQSRLRSASSPDFQNLQGARRTGGSTHPPMPDVPVPPFPTHFAYAPNLVGRSQANSPAAQAGLPMSVPLRAATQSPSLQRERLAQGQDVHEQYQYDHSTRLDPRQPSMARNQTSIEHSRSVTPVSFDQRATSPTTSATSSNYGELPTPTQLKVKVHCPSAGSTMTLVVSTNISYQSLKDRIDAKLQRSTNMSLSAGQVRLKYMDEGDYVSIQSDEDVQTAFETWKEQQRDRIVAGQLGEIELYCQR